MNEPDVALCGLHGQQTCGRGNGFQIVTLIGAGCMDDHARLSAIQEDSDFLGILKITDMKGDVGEG
jgi:hypothetical protein